MHWLAVVLEDVSRPTDVRRVAYGAVSDGSGFPAPAGSRFGESGSSIREFFAKACDLVFVLLDALVNLANGFAEFSHDERIVAWFTAARKGKVALRWLGDAQMPLSVENYWNAETTAN